MSKPTILSVDDDPMVAAAVARDLRSRYGAEYRIVSATSGAEALAVLAKLALRDQPVALIVADQRMPGMSGVEMLGEARANTVGAKYLLLTAYADTDAAIKAINDVGLDYYLMKPWDPPDERLYPVIDELLPTGARRTRSTRPTSASWVTAGPTVAMRSRCSSRAITCPIAGTTSNVTPRASGC